jgi:cell division protease FtsH
MRPFWIYVVLLIGAGFLLQSLSTGDERIPYTRFRSMAEQGQLSEVDIKGDTYVGRVAADPAQGGVRAYRTGRIADSEKELLTTLDEHHVPYTRLADDRSLTPYLVWLIPIGGAIALFYVFSSKKLTTPQITNPALSFGKNKARLYVDKGSPVTFRDVAGCQEAKAELAELVEFLRSPERYKRLGGRTPKGVLLVGPPGTGKTLLARAVAGEASVPFYSVCGSEFVEMFVGVGAARVRDLFAQAQEKPTGIIFVDELDAVGKARGSGGPIGGNDEREQTLNQLLTEMDGFDARTGLIVLAATNRPEILDPALLRAGRFDRRVFIDRPDLNERREILRVHGRNVLLSGAVDLTQIAGQTPGLVGADLANIVNEAALLAARRKADEVCQVDLEEALERVIGGLERPTRRLGERERQIVAYHEAGHALMAELLPSQDPVRKISIIPRGLGALGYTMQQPREDRYLMSRNEILDRLVVLLGGRVAEEVTVGDVSTGAQDDLAKATDLARRMVRELGMSETVGLSTVEARSMSDRLMGAGTGSECSDATLRFVDAEVSRLLDDAHGRAKRLLCDHRSHLERIAQRLLTAETLSGEELRRMLTESPPMAV